MGLIQKWGGAVSKSWKKGYHYVNQRWGHAADFVDRKIPELKFDVKADIKTDVTINKDNFNVDLDSSDIASAGESIGQGIGTGLQSVANSFESFGQSLTQGLEQLGEELGQSVQFGLDELGNDVVAASTQLTAGIASHGASVEHASESLGSSLSQISFATNQTAREVTSQLSSAIERFDASGGLGRHLMSVVTHAHAAGTQLMALDRYFSRVSGEYRGDSYLLKVANASAKPYPDFELYATVVVGGLGGEEFQRLYPDVKLAGRGHYHLSFGGQETPETLSKDASPAEVQSALENLSSIGTGNVRCYGVPLSQGVMEVVLDSSISAGDISIVLHGLTGDIQVERVPTSGPHTFDVKVSGDPDSQGLVDVGNGKAINFGPVRREFGIPYIASVTHRFLASPERAKAIELSRIARNVEYDGSSEVEVDPPYPPDFRRKAAAELASLGPHAVEEADKIADYLVNAGDELDRLTRKILLSAKNAIDSYEISVAASVLLAGGETLEPISMLTSLEHGTGSSIRSVSGNIPIAIEYLPVSGIPHSCVDRQSVVGSVGQNFLAAAQTYADPRAGNQPSDGQSTAVVESLAISLSEAVRRTRELAEELRAFIPPDPFKSGGRSYGVYDIAREVLNPTIVKLHAHQAEFRFLKQQFDMIFGGYESTGMLDPVMSHVLGIESLAPRGGTFVATVICEVTGRRTSTTRSVTVDISVAHSGEALFPLPTRGVDDEPIDVVVTVVASDSTDLLLSHFSGMAGEYALHSQTLGSTFRFAARRVIGVA